MPRAQHERHVDLHPALRAHLADQPHADERRVLGQRAEQQFEQWSREALEGDRSRDRVPGDADHGCPLHRAERDRMGGTQGDTVGDELAEPTQDGRRVIGPPA